MIIRKSPAEIEAMKEAGRVSAKVLREVGAQVRPGVSTLELDELAEALIRAEGGVPAFKGYGVVREYVGHGIGRDMHEDPNVPNFGRKHTGVKLEAGMVLAIEPMINLGTYKTRQMPDGWLVCTRDGLPSAHFEKTVAITEDGPVILTTEEGHRRPV